VQKHEVKNHLEVIDVDVRILLKYHLKCGVGNMDWIRLAEDRDRLWSHVFAQINFRFLNFMKFVDYYGLYIVLETTLMKLVKRLNDT